MATRSFSVHDKVTRSNRILYYRLFYIIAAIVVVLDRTTKWVVQKTLPFGSYDPSNMVEVIPNFFYICHIGNTGAAWGLFHGMSFLLATFSLVALVLLYVFRKALGLRNLYIQISLGFVAGGILGNLYDRFVFNHVVDFLDVHLGFYRWPAFNVADASILIGVLFFSWISFNEEAAKKNQ
ncbi:MAG: signal peptidase II [Verrucomicrobia bacterium]|nr:signal peptidase II [Verrucomicrobiota bacterium]